MELFWGFLSLILLHGASGCIIFVCSPQNDVFSLLSSSPQKRVDTFAEALSEAPDGCGIVILADLYPSKQNSISAQEFSQAASKNLRLYLEYPSSLPFAQVGSAKAANYYHRLVVYSNSTIDLPTCAILFAHGSYFVPISFDTSLSGAVLVYANVAGYDVAVFGLPPDKELDLVLFMQKGDGTTYPDMLVGATKLSDITTGRYGPIDSWRRVWSSIFQAVSPDDNLSLPSWKPAVGARYNRSQQLPNDAEKSAFLAAVDWFSSTSGLFGSNDNHTCPAPYVPANTDFGCLCEGYGSAIAWNGSQSMGQNIRMDCNCEGAAAMALGSLLSPVQSPRALSLATQAAMLLDFTYFWSVAQQGPRGDPSNPAYGLVSWGVAPDTWLDSLYGDDNARVTLGSLAAAAALQNNRWDQSVLKSMLGNLRTTSQFGFRPSAISMEDLEKNGWEYYFNSDLVYNNTSAPQPHYQAYPWATFLWAYYNTGARVFLDRALSGIRQTMEVYEASDGKDWKWTETITEELSHLVLPLAWLVRVNVTPDAAKWLDEVLQRLQSTQQQEGYIQERLGTPGLCQACPPTSNQMYGTGEAPIIQQDGNPCADMLYTQNFLVIGLHEAAAAAAAAGLMEAGSRYSQMEDALVEFLLRIQAVNPGGQQAYLQGSWLRAFDSQQWDIWGSASDTGWGPWSVESGWTVSWITTTLFLRMQKTSLWEFTSASTSISPDLFMSMCSSFLPDNYCNVQF